MTKFNLLPKEEQDLINYIGGKWIRFLSLAPLFALGIWMLLDPEKPEHEYIEKASVALVKDLWGIPFALVILAIAIPLIIYTIYQIVRYHKIVFIRLSTGGYYLFNKKVRIKGKHSIYNGSDLMIFHPEENQVIALPRYQESKFDTYTYAKESKEFDNDGIYWSATKDGYTIIYKGKYLDDTTSERRGDDLVVNAPKNYLKLLLKNYWNLKNGKIHKGSLA